MAQPSTLVTALALALAGIAGCSSSHRSGSQLSGEDARAALIDRNWIDVMPARHEDRLHVYRFVPSMGGGVYQDRTLFKGNFELFTFEASSETLRFVFPHTRERVTSRYTIEPVAGRSPFDLKLTITDDPRGPGVYFGTRAEQDRAGLTLDRLWCRQPDLCIPRP